MKRGNKRKIENTMSGDTSVKLSPLCERLISQMIVAQQRDDELLMYSRALAQYSADKQTLTDKITSLNQQLSKIDSVKSALVASFTASRQAYQRAIDDDEVKRKELSAELQKRITAVNEYAETVTQRHAKVLHENSSLKEQRSLLLQHRATGEGKFQELVQAREKELENIRNRLAKEKEREPLLEEAVSKTAELTEITRQEHDQWKAKVDTYVERFNDIQRKLVESRNCFDTAKDDREKISRRIKAMESDRQVIISRAEKAKNERNIEYAKVCELESKISILEGQTKKLTELHAALTAQAAVHQDPVHQDPQA